MHLWPSERLRESFKKSYLDKLDLNLYKMNRDKKNKTSNQQNLLEADNGDTENNRCGLLRDLLLIVSCCFFCGDFGVTAATSSYSCAAHGPCTGEEN